MRSRSTFFVFSCLFICVCIGVPPKRIGETSNSYVNRYTDQEDQLIVDELLRISENKRYIPVTGKYVWKEIVAKHRENWLQKTSGFNRERTEGGLRSRFLDVLVHNHDTTNVKVPDTLKEKFVDSNRKTQATQGPKKHIKYPYTEEENSFITEELSKPTNGPINVSIYKRIQAEHDRRRRANTPGFENERSMVSINSRICTMKENGQFPPEIMEKFQKRRRGADGCESSHSSAQIDFPVFNEDENAEMDKLIHNFLGDAEMAPKSSTLGSYKYTEEENKFIVSQLSSFCNDGVPLSHKELWEKLAERHREKLQASTSGFPQERSARSLYFHFKLVMVPAIQQNRLEVPETLMQDIFDPKTKKIGKGSKTRYTKEEDDLIIEELKKPSCISIFGLPTMQRIRSEFDRKREARVQGFQNERSLRSVRSRLFTLKRRNLLPPEVMEKIWLHPTAASSSGSTHLSHETDTQTYDMVEELEHADWDVDFEKIGFSDEE